MEKKRVVVSFENLSAELQEVLKKKYPYGFLDSVIKVNTATSHFYAVTMDTEDSSYLVKVNVKIDSKSEDVDNDDLGDEDSESGDDFGTPEDDFDNIPDTEE